MCQRHKKNIINQHTDKFEMEGIIQSVHQQRFEKTSMESTIQERVVQSCSEKPQTSVELTAMS